MLRLFYIFNAFWRSTKHISNFPIHRMSFFLFYIHFKLATLKRKRERYSWSKNKLSCATIYSKSGNSHEPDNKKRPAFQPAIAKGADKNMKKYKVLLCMLMAAMVISACGNQDAENPSDVPASQDETDNEENDADEDDAKDEETADDEEDSKDEEIVDDEETAEDDEALDEDDWAALFEIPESTTEQHNPYTGHTLPEVLEDGFEVTGYMSSGMGSSYNISLFMDRGIERLTVSVSVDEEVYGKFSDLDGTDSKAEYFAELFGASALTYANSSLDYNIMTARDLQSAVEMGAYEIVGDIQGKTIGELMEDGYDYINESYWGDDCMITMRRDNIEYTILIDLSEKNEELDLFRDDGEDVLQDYTAVEGYTLKVS